MHVYYIVLEQTFERNCYVQEKYKFFCCKEIVNVQLLFHFDELVSLQNDHQKTTSLKTFQARSSGLHCSFLHQVQAKKNPSIRFAVLVNFEEV